MHFSGCGQPPQPELFISQLSLNYVDSQSPNPQRECVGWGGVVWVLGVYVVSAVCVLAVLSEFT